MKSLFAALRFLTALPMPGGFGAGEEELARSPLWFPAVGVLLGGLAALVARGLNFAPPMPAAAITVLLLVGLSGALHLDGLSDTADGFLSSRPRERILEIMKDSHVGVMGVLAVAGMLLMKTTSIGSIPRAAWPGALFLMPVAGRCGILLQMAILPYARPEGGLAAIFYRRRTVLPLLIALGVLGVSAVWVAGWRGLAAAAVAMVVSLLFSAWSYVRIGGATGDTLGAACELSELSVAFTLACWHAAPGAIT
jgi:adenosylcobinamide-GDP ribazoletransferase